MSSHAPNPTQRLAISGVGVDPREVSDDYAVLIRNAGWRVLERIDVTEEYVGSLRALVKGLTRLADALIEAIGPDEYDEIKQRREFQVDAHGRGLLRREIFVSATG